MEVRLDNTYNPNITERKIYQFDNGFACSLPKSDRYLYKELVEAGQEQFQVSTWPNDNSVGADSFTLSFYTFDDEPIGENLLFMNWGIFSDNMD